MITRELESTIKRDSKGYQIITITGPRQSGKTTLVKKLFSEYLYVSLESPETRQFAIEDPKTFLQQSNYMIIDEAQYVPELFSYIQVLTDEDRQRNYVLTGSQKFLLLGSITQSLAGRVAIFDLFPFTLSELSRSKKSGTLSEALYRGLYPRIIDRDLEPRGWYASYIATYLERDVRSIKNVQNLNLFHKLLQLCASRVGSVLNVESLANDLGISAHTVRSWLSVLEASHIIFFLQPFYKNFRKRITKAPKLYFYDTGLICSLLEIHSPDQLQTHPLRGSIFEDFVVAEHHKLNAHRGSHIPFYYFRDKTGNEVDLVFERDNSTLLSEIKSSATFNTEFIKGMNYFDIISGKTNDKIVIYNGESQKRSNVHLFNWKDIELK